MESDRTQTKETVESTLPKQKGWSIWLKLLITTPIVGTVAAFFALPALFNSTSCACGKEASTYVGSINKGQQAYFIENNKFGSSVDVLGIGVKTDLPNYIYSTRVATPKSAFNYGISKRADRHSYVGGVFVVPVPKTTDVTTLAILCEANAPGMITPSDPFMKDGKPTCAPDTQLIGQ
ncbi:hypothetical protein TUMEXPCC7403_20840 [Tumidithrix helvetica PCC 7403]|uniref:type IV pilin-like G/H family protein n=1 Tax=Tumidithrix helvetica TaxID=3457545 RepID=UPI003C9F8CFA